MARDSATAAAQDRPPAGEAPTQSGPGRVSGPAGLRDAGMPVLLGESVVVRRLRSQIRRLAPYFRTALLRGEAGSGKGAVARAIHAGSVGRGGPFVEAQAWELAEPFAREGAVRGPSMQFAGPLLESALRGTLYLRGAGELPLELQAGLLEFLRTCEERRGPPTGGVRNGFRRAEVRMRVLVSSRCDLRIPAAIGQYRQDLLAQLSAVEMVVPPLRRRVEDIPLLGKWLLGQLAEATGEHAKQLAEATIVHLQKATWPGNLRELERVVAQAAALAEGEWIEPRHLLTLVEPGNKPVVRLERLHDVIERHVLEMLMQCGGNKLRAAELLGISRSTLYRMLGDGPGRRMGA